MIIAVILFSFIILIDCAINSNSTFPTKKIKTQYKKIKFTDEQRVEQFVKTIKSFEAFNLKQKYELGRTIAHIIHNIKMEKAGGSIKKSKRKYEEKIADETDVIDLNPERSWRIAETYIKAYKDKPTDEEKQPETTETDIKACKTKPDYGIKQPESFIEAFKAEEQQLQNGWSSISTNLRQEPVYVRSKVLIRAIADEEVALVKRLVQEKYSVINIEKYNFAVKNYKERGTEKCEAIIDFIEKGNPELGAAISRNDKLLAGWDQIKVQEYIYENNYPMLRRALDDGFDPNSVVADRGSLLGLSVVAGCYRCVKMLIERNVDVNEPILFDEQVKVKGWDQSESVSVKGWTPLMFAVADGNIRIVKELIESGTALVSKTAIGQEESKFHARAAARKIKDNDLRKDILKNLRLSSTEKNTLVNQITGKSFEDSLKKGNLALIDSFLLLRNDLNLENIQVFEDECHDDALRIIQKEVFEMKTQQA